MALVKKELSVTISLDLEPPLFAVLVPVGLLLFVGSEGEEVYRDGGVSYLDLQFHALRMRMNVNSMVNEMSIICEYNIPRLATR